MQLTLGDFDAGLAAKYESVKFAEFCVLLIELAMLDQLADRGNGQCSLGVTLIGLSMVTELDGAKLGNGFALNKVGSHVPALSDLQQASVVDSGGFTNDTELAVAMFASEGLNLIKCFADLTAGVFALPSDHCAARLHGPVKRAAPNIKGDIDDFEGLS